MLYFSNAPVRPDSVDQVQYAQLTSFKEWARREGLIETFESSGDFRLKFFRQLSLTLRDNPYLMALTKKPLTTPSGVRSAPDFSLTRPRGIGLSGEAHQLLTAAAADQQGMIILVRTLSGAIIQAGETPFGDTQDQRSIAKWEEAIRELARAGFVRDTDGSGQYFRVTDTGYRAVE